MPLSGGCLVFPDRFHASSFLGRHRLGRHHGDPIPGRDPEYFDTTAKTLARTRARGEVRAMRRGRAGVAQAVRMAPRVSAGGNVGDVGDVVAS